MIEYKDLNYKTRNEIYNKAFTFRHDNADEIAKGLNKKGPRISPNGNDLLKPELWKPCHWNWFVYELQNKETK